MPSKQPRAIETLDDVRDRCRIDDETGCWLWTMALSSNEHGCALPVAQYQKRNRTVNRIVFDLLGRKPGAIIWRTCCDRTCVNPAHMRTGSRAQWGEWVTKSGHMRGDPIRRALNRRTKLASGTCKLTPELAAWVRESPQTGVELAALMGLSETAISRVRVGRAWAQIGSPFAGLMAASARPVLRTGKRT